MQGRQQRDRSTQRAEQCDRATQRAEQDRVLVDIEHGLTRLYGQAGVIGQELKEQDGIINEVDDAMDATDDKFIIVNDKLGQLLHKGKSCCIPYGIIMAEIVFIVILVLILIAA